VRIDSQGRPSAELIAAGPVPAVAQTNFAAASAKLINDFGFSAVSGWAGQNATKDAAEISDVLAALELLKSRAPQDVAALNGVELIRVPVPVILTDGERRGAEFFEGSYVALGNEADIKPYLKIADEAFALNNIQFFGGGPDSPTVPASFHTILHEVGHGVEKQEHRLARKDVIKASAELEAAKKRVATVNVDPGNVELSKAKSKGSRTLKDFRKQQDAAYKQAEEAEVKASEHDVEERNRLRNTKDPATQNTLRLQKFITLVENNHIRPFTERAAKSREEFYAEAYALWLDDPAFLRTNWKVVYDFFENGDYRK
jgi:hypothetical protein